MTAPQTKVRRAGRELEKDRRAIVNHLVDYEGWTYRYGLSGHFKLIPPNPDLPIVVSGTTPSDFKGTLNWITDLKRSGARLNPADARKVRTVSTGTDDAPVTAIENDIAPILTIGAWWRTVNGEEPEPEPAPLVVEKPRPHTPTNPRLDPDAKGERWSLAQARTMLRQGYHINKVIARTGWGRNWLADLVDDTGFFAEASSVSAVAF